jgi:hypothetical protein
MQYDYSVDGGEDGQGKRNAKKSIAEAGTERSGAQQA